MIQFINGAVGSGKTTALISRIYADIKSGKRVLAIVPDQFSFEFENLLYNSLGINLFNSGLLKISSFKKLAETITVNAGNSSKKYASDAISSVVMFRAIKNLNEKKLLKTYKRQAKYPAFRAKALLTVRELAENRILPEILYNKFKETDKPFAEKMTETALIYAEYLAELEKSGYFDSVTILDDAAKIAKRMGFFRGYEVYADAFSGFTAGETELLKVIFSDAENFTAALSCEAHGTESDEQNEFSPYAPVIFTLKKLKSVCSDLKIIPNEITLDTRPRFKSNDLKIFGDNVLVRTKQPERIYPENIRVFRGRDIYKEAEFAAAQISELTVEQGFCRFCDIIITVQNAEDIAGVFESVFSRFHIPLWIDEKLTITGKTSAVFLLSFLDCLCDGGTDEFLQLFKTGLISGENDESFTDSDINTLEEFLYKNDFQSGMPFEPFFDEIPETMRTAVLPLFEIFSIAAQSNRARDYVKALADVTEKANIKTKLLEKITNETSTDTEVLSGLRQETAAWNLLSELLCDLYGSFSDEDTLTLEEFRDHFKAAVSDCRIKFPRQAADCVTLMSAATARYGNPRCVFVIGANEDILPAKPSRNSLLSDTDLIILSDDNIKIRGSYLEKISEERFAALSAVTAASEKLFISYREADSKGGSMYPSDLVRDALRIFGDSVMITPPSEWFCRTPESAYSMYLTGDNRDNAVKSALKRIPEYSDRINLKHFDKKSITPDNAHKLYGKIIRMSASSLERFMQCPFKYFAQDGLKLYPREKIELTPALKGSAIHFCLQKVGEGIRDKKYSAENKEQVIIDTAQFLDEFYNNTEQMGAKQYKTERFRQGFCKLKKTIDAVALHLVDEFEQSEFRPVEFEYSFGQKDDTEPPFKIGSDIEFRGKVDRIDTWSNGENEYIRIIDYKSSDKTLDFSKIYEGLTLQPFIYIFALTDNSANKFKGDLPAGILYLFAHEQEPKLDRNATDEELSEYSFIPEGAVTDNRDILNAMEEIPNKSKGRFIPVKITASGALDAKSKVLSDDEFKAIREFTIEKVTKAGEEILNGNIDAKPISKVISDHDSCNFCEFGGICGNFPPKEDTVRSYTFSNTAAKQEIINRNFLE
ncbi:MAG: PD-(D/E)XK nuclease family protein [Ruminococcus sp.]|jgi:ATP-dependent helicase/nuclease subunit B|nr:PD-(D/E)XK nuclease family protein [Ruminococcus sp.]